jgi:hypothetical protein
MATPTAPLPIGAGLLRAHVSVTCSPIRGLLLYSVMVLLATLLLLVVLPLRQCRGVHGLPHHSSGCPIPSSRLMLDKGGWRQLLPLPEPGPRLRG